MPPVYRSANRRAARLTRLSAAACFLAAPRPVPLLDEMLKLVGWAITAFAVLFGAPFWFEALSRLGSLRSAGTPPAQTPAQA